MNMTDTPSPKKRARERTRFVMEQQEPKSRAGEWVSLEDVRRAIYKVCVIYEEKLEHMYDLCDSYEQMFAEAMGEEE
jgi:hypothetical protein